MPPTRPTKVLVETRQLFGYAKAFEAAMGHPFRCPDAFYISAVNESGQFLGGVAYSNFTAFDCCVDIASTSPYFLTRDTLRAFFSYPFLQLGLKRITGIVREDNARAMSLDLRLGFTPEGSLRNYFGDRSGIIMGMLREECRWITLPKDITNGQAENA